MYDHHLLQVLPTLDSMHQVHRVYLLESLPGLDSIRHVHVSHLLQAGLLNQHTGCIIIIGFRSRSIPSVISAVLAVVRITSSPNRTIVRKAEPAIFEITATTYSHISLPSSISSDCGGTHKSCDRNPNFLQWELYIPDSPWFGLV